MPLSSCTYGLYEQRTLTKLFSALNMLVLFLLFAASCKTALSASSEVSIVTSSNFSAYVNTVKDNNLKLVFFYAPWCKHSQVP